MHVQPAVPGSAISVGVLLFSHAGFLRGGRVVGSCICTRIHTKHEQEEKQPPLMFASLRFSYERLSADFPEYDSYKLYHAQVCQTPIYWGFFFVSLKPLFPDCVCVCLLSLTRWLLQALYKACLYDEAMDIVVKLDNPDLHTEIMKLQVLKQPWCLC